MRRCGTLVAITIVIGLVALQALSIINHRHLLRVSKTSIDSLELARVNIVPQAIDRVAELPHEFAVQQLRERFDSTEDSAKKLALAFGLARMSVFETEFLVSMINQSNSRENKNFYFALSRNATEAQQTIRRVSKTLNLDSQRQQKARLAIVALYLGDPTLAVEFCTDRLRPAQQAIFINEFSMWHDPDRSIHQFATKIASAEWKSTISLALGTLRLEQLSGSDRREWTSSLLRWHRDEPNGYVHSASDWTLRKWRVAIPKTDSPGVDSQQEWSVNSLGMTMLRIPSGEFSRQDTFLLEKGLSAQRQEVIVSKDFLMSDREISIRQFLEFFDSYEQKPFAWSGEFPHPGKTNEHPIQFVNWYETLIFCNWLSEKEKLQPCYQWNPDRRNFEFIATANGYRLPTEAEWEHACRAGSTTERFFGNVPELLPNYAVYNTIAPEICGNRMPNRWGLFDLYGNVYEWCHSWSSPYGDLPKVTDPVASNHNGMRAMRGGMYSNPESPCTSMARNRNGPNGRSKFLGFRVVRSL